MTDTHGPPAACRDDIQVLLGDLAIIAGTLSEIATVWRRAKPYLPGLPLILPVQLQDAARQLAAGIQAPAGGGPGERARSAADLFSELKQGLASARAMTCGPGLPRLGDGRLWESLLAPLQRAEAQLSGLRPHLVAVGD